MSPQKHRSDPRGCCTGLVRPNLSIATYYENLRTVSIGGRKE